MVSLKQKKLEYTLTASHGTAYYFNTGINAMPTSVIAKINNPGSQLLCMDFAELTTFANRLGISYRFDEATGTLQCYFYVYGQTQPWKLVIMWN